MTVELVKPTEFCHSIRSDFFEISFKSFFRFAKHIFISRLDITNPGSSSRTPSVKFYKIIYRACVPLHVLSGFGVNLSRRSAESPANGLEYEDYDRISLGKHSLGKHSSRKCYRLRRIVVLHILPILIFYCVQNAKELLISFVRFSY